MSVPNQMIIQEFNYEPCNETNYYAKINLEALQHAMQDLSSLNALKLWLYLSKNKVGFSHLELSSADCINNWGLGRSQWKETKLTLISKGYLVPLKVDKKTGWYKFIQNPDSGNNDENPETELLIYDDLPETGILSDNKNLETEEKIRKPEKYKVIENPETGKLTNDKNPETGILKPDSEQNSPEIIEERLQYNIDNNNIDITNKEEWLECRGYTLDDALTNLGGQKVFEDESWVYVLANRGKNKIKFKKSSNAWDISMF
jgi:hypothetical protein